MPRRYSTILAFLFLVAATLILPSGPSNAGDATQLLAANDPVIQCMAECIRTEGKDEKGGGDCMAVYKQCKKDCPKATKKACRKQCKKRLTSCV
jgi:hypothetical protein